MINRFGAAIVLASTTWLAGCITGPGPVTSAASRTAGAVSTAAILAPAPEPPEPGLARKTPQAAPVAPRLSREELNPDRLLRMRDGQVSDILGKPGFIRRDAEARVWQYRISACVLDLFLYDDAAEYRVIDYEFRGASGASVSAPDCFENLLLRRATTATS